MAARGFDDDVVRTLTFTARPPRSRSLWDGVDGWFRVDGWLTPGEIRDIVLHAPGASAAAVGRTRSDSDGRCVVHDVPPDRWVSP